jgi:hypothetical protein
MNMLARNSWRPLGLLAAVALMLATASPTTVSAASPVPSLDIVPADAAFYSAMLHNREQIEAIANSKAFAKLRDLPLVQMGLGYYKIQAADPDSVPGKIDAALRDPETKKSLEFLGDILSDEIFFYGGPSVNDSIELVQGTYTALQFGPVMAGISSKTNIEEVQGKAFVRALAERTELIKCPELVMGFKVKNKALAQEQLDKLDMNLQVLLAMSPIFEKRFERKKVGGHSYMTLSLDGDMIPWDAQVLEKIRSLAATPADGDKLIEHLKKTKIVISLGLRDDYLILAIGPSTDVLKKLGGDTPLSSLPELAAVKKFGDKRITSVGYASKALNRHLSQTKEGIDNLVKWVDGILPTMSVPQKLHDELMKDAAEMAKDIKPMIPEVGAATRVEFLTDSGYESFSYDWSEHPELDGSKPLDLLKHVGGNPILAFVGRSKVSPEGYDVLVKWLKIGYRYVEEYAVPQMKPKEREQFEKFVSQAKPLLGRLDKATRNLLLPALADGQIALVLDAKLTSRQFIKALPATEEPLSMIEPAVVLGVSDAAKLREAFAEYYAVADEFVELIKNIEGSEVPKDFTLPRPREFKLRQGSVYGYMLPAAWGVDSRVMPNAGLSEKVAVLSISGRHTQRLLSETEPKIAGLSLPTDRPLAGVGGFDFAALVDAVTPWVNFGIEKGFENGPKQQLEMARQHSKVILEVLKVYRGTVWETYAEGDVTVTHSRSVIHDIEE